MQKTKAALNELKQTQHSQDLPHIAELAKEQRDNEGRHMLRKIDYVSDSDAKPTYLTHP